MTNVLMPNDQRGRRLLVIGHWLLIGHWDLVIGRFQPYRRSESLATARATGPYSAGLASPLARPCPLPLPFPLEWLLGCRAMDRIDIPLIDRSKSLDWARLNTTPARRAPMAARWPRAFSTIGRCWPRA